MTPAAFPIAFAISGERDAPMLAVSARSLALSCARREALRFHILHAGVSAEIRRRLDDSWSDLGLTTSWHDMEALLGPSALEPIKGHYFRAYLGTVLPDVERVLYLDYDTVIGRDVTELWEHDLSDQVAAVVWDACDTLFNYGVRLKRSAERIGRHRSDVGYFNAGVMFMNLEQWRQRGLESQVMALVEGHPGWSTFVIQDELNLVLQDLVRPLCPCWNLLDTLVLYDAWDFALYRGLGAPEDYFHRAIVHFAGKQKPFHPLVRSSAKSVFYEILDQTRWKGWRSESDRSWWGPRLANLLELHWIVCRGLKLSFLSHPWRRIWHLCRRDPSVLVTYLAIPAWRAFRRLHAAGKRLLRSVGLV